MTATNGSSHTTYNEDENKPNEWHIPPDEKAPATEMTPAPSSKRLRKGKWTAEEETFANRLIYYFQHGLLSLPDGTTLRAYIADKLECDPMRISKKFTGNDRIGKQIFKSCEKNLEDFQLRMLTAEKELRMLEARFRAREWPEKGKDLDIEGSMYSSEWDESSIRMPQKEAMDDHRPPSSPNPRMSRFYQNLDNTADGQHPGRETLEMSMYPSNGLTDHRLSSSHNRARKRKYDHPLDEAHPEKKFGVDQLRVGDGGIDMLRRYVDTRDIYYSNPPPGYGRRDPQVDHRYGHEMDDRRLAEREDMADLMRGGMYMRHHDAMRGPMMPWGMGPRPGMMASNPRPPPVMMDQRGAASMNYHLQLPVNGMHRGLPIPEPPMMGFGDRGGGVGHYYMPPPGSGGGGDHPPMYFDEYHGLSGLNGGDRHGGENFRLDEYGYERDPSASGHMMENSAYPKTAPDEPPRTGAVEDGSS